MELWFEGAAHGANLAVVDGLPPLPTLRRHSTLELRRGPPSRLCLCPPLRLSAFSFAGPASPIVRVARSISPHW